MRILFITPYPPSPLRVRSFELVRALANRGHQLVLGFPIWNARELADTAEIVQLGFTAVPQRPRRFERFAGVALALATGDPIQARVSYSGDLARTMVDLVRGADQRFDVVHVEHLRSALYALRLRPHAPIVWDSVDSISELFRQAASSSRATTGRAFAWVDGRRTRRFEGRLVRELGHVVVTSELDRQSLIQLAGTDGRQSIAVVRNGVDLERFRPGSSPREPNTAILSGRLSYHANETAALDLIDDIMPQVWPRVTEATVILAGPHPGRALVRRAAARPRHVRLTGYVDDLGAVIGRCAVATAPLSYGVGIQNKVLEAMATATPVVTTSTGAEGLSAVPGHDLLVAAHPAQFADSVVALMQDPTAARQLGVAGRRYVANHHSWDAAAASLEVAYARAIEDFSRAGPS